MSSLRFTEINSIGNKQEIMKMMFLIFLVLLVDIVSFVMADVFIDSLALLVNIAKDCLLTGQGSPSCLFSYLVVTMPKMA